MCSTSGSSWRQQRRSTRRATGSKRHLPTRSGRRFLTESYPDAILVAVIRNVTDVVASNVHGFGKPGSAWAWFRQSVVTAVYEKIIRRSSALIVRYEDLRDRYDDTVRSVAGRLGLARRDPRQRLRPQQLLRRRCSAHALVAERRNPVRAARGVPVSRSAHRGRRRVAGKRRARLRCRRGSSSCAPPTIVPVDVAPMSTRTFDNPHGLALHAVLQGWWRGARTADARAGNGRAGPDGRPARCTGRRTVSDPDSAIDQRRRPEGTPRARGAPRSCRVPEARSPSALLSALPHANVVAVWARSLSGVRTRLVVSEHTVPSLSARHAEQRRARMLPLFMRRAYPRADAIVAVSDGAADDLAALLSSTATVSRASTTRS